MHVIGSVHRPATPHDASRPLSPEPPHTPEPTPASQDGPARSRCGPRKNNERSRRVHPNHACAPTGTMGHPGRRSGTIRARNNRHPSDTRRPRRQRSEQRSDRRVTSVHEAARPGACGPYSRSPVQRVAERGLLVFTTQHPVQNQSQVAHKQKRNTISSSPHTPHTHTHQPHARMRARARSNNLTSQAARTERI